MSPDERISVIAYVKERFDSQDRTLGKQDKKLDDIAERLESLEADRDQRRGRNNFLATAGKFGGAIIAALAALFGIKSHIS